MESGSAREPDEAVSDEKSCQSYVTAAADSPSNIDLQEVSGDDRGLSAAETMPTENEVEDQSLSTQLETVEVVRQSSPEEVVSPRGNETNVPLTPTTEAEANAEIIAEVQGEGKTEDRTTTEIEDAVETESSGQEMAPNYAGASMHHLVDRPTVVADDEDAAFVFEKAMEVDAVEDLQHVQASSMPILARILRSSGVRNNPSAVGAAIRFFALHTNLVSLRHRSSVPTFGNSSSGEHVSLPARALSSVSGRGGRPSRQCSICLNDVAKSAMVEWGACSHRFCRECLDTYCSMKIREGAILDIRCPNTDCRNAVTRESLRKMVNDKVFEEYENATMILYDPSSRSCPQCSYVQGGSKRKMRMSCENCATDYCFLHGDAHSPSKASDCSDAEWTKACKTFLAREKAAKKLFAKWAKENAKFCPKCRAPIEKTDMQSCNHIYCKCGFNFCWICGRAYDPNNSQSLLAHYSRFNPLGCPGSQFQQAHNPHVLRLRRAGLFVAFPFICLFVMPGLLIKRGVEAVKYLRVRRLYRS